VGLSYDLARCAKRKLKRSSKEYIEKVDCFTRNHGQSYNSRGLGRLPFVGPCLRQGLCINLGLTIP
jgi:hypothetical protein